MPKVGLISDTHGRFPDAVFQVFEACDYIIHAGDICSPGVLIDLQSIATTIAVYGNCDLYDYDGSVKTTADATIGGVRVFVSHFPDDAERAARTGKFGLAVHGHTHVPRDEVIDACRVVNPGSTTRPRGGSSACVAIVDLEDGKVGPVQFIEV